MTAIHHRIHDGKENNKINISPRFSNIWDETLYYINFLYYFKCKSYIKKKIHSAHATGIFRSQPVRSLKLNGKGGGGKQYSVHRRLPQSGLGGVFNSLSQQFAIASIRTCYSYQRWGSLLLLHKGSGGCPLHNVLSAFSVVHLDMSVVNFSFPWLLLWHADYNYFV